MSKIEFSVEINPEKKAVARAAIELIAAMAEISLVHSDNPMVPKTDLHELKVVGTEEEKPEEAPAEKPKKKTRKTAKKAEPAPEPEPEVAEEEETEEEETEEVEEAWEEETAESEVSIEDIRAKLKDVVRDHRDGIKSKLDELGASSASTLDKKHYGAFYAYLGKLK